MLKVTADLTPVNAKKVAVKFDFFKIGGLVSILVKGPVQFFILTLIVDGSNAVAADKWK